MIYLDNNATTQIDPAVLEAMMPFLQEQYGNPGSLYRAGRLARSAIEEARGYVADFVGANPKNVVFTSGGTEANNTVFYSTLRFLHKVFSPHILVSAIEHDSILNITRRLAAAGQILRTIIPVNENGVVSTGQVKDLLQDNVGLVSVMAVNNEVGSINPINDIAKLCSQNGVLFHTDCVQAAGTHRLNFKEIGCNFMSLSSHKIHGPKGVGALITNFDMEPMIYGGKRQEFGLRGGTENVAGIVGFGAACKLMNDTFDETTKEINNLKHSFIQHLRYELENEGLGSLLHVNGNSDSIPGKTLNIRFDGIDAETLLLLLDSRDVCVSAGAACSSFESEPSHVLLAMGIDAEDARNSIRISFSKMNTQNDIAEAIEKIILCIKILNNSVGEMNE